MKNRQKGFVVPLVIAIVALLVVAGAAYFYVQSTRVCPAWGCNGPHVKDISSSTSTTQQSSSDQSSAEISNWKTYTDVHFSVQYPLGWSTVESSDGNTVTFTPPTTGGNDGLFSVSIKPIDNKLANIAGTIAGYTQLFGSRLQKSTVKINIGQSATVLSVNDNSTPSNPINFMKIIFALNGKFYTISESGLTYYNSPVFTKLYTSFEIVN